MDAFDLFRFFILSMLALCVIVPIFQAGSKARKKAAQERAQAEKEAQALEARRRAEERARAQRAEKERAAAQKAQEREQREAARKQKQAEKLEAARQLAEYKERALQAEKELQALRRAPVPAPAQQPQEAPQQLQEAPAQQAEEQPQEQPAPLSLAQFAQQNAPQPFAGEVVAFTGTLPAMKRAEAIQATAQRGGRAYDTINTNCTLLVIGVKPGTFQLERAQRWNVKTITWAEWYDRAGISYRRRLAAQGMARRATA